MTPEARSPEPASHVGRRALLPLLRAHGWNATSFQALGPSMRHFTCRIDEEELAVAYVDTGRAWVAAGAPIGPEGKLLEAARAFVEAASAGHRRASFFGVEQRLIDATGWPSLLLGEQPRWDPSRWPDQLRATRSLREQLRRARAKGVRIRRLAADEVRSPRATLRASIEALVERWLASRAMAPMGFLVDMHPFSCPDERRFYVAERAGRVVAFASLAPVYARRGWLVEHLLREADAPNGTLESLVDRVMTDAAREGDEMVTLGLAPLCGSVSPLLAAARALGRGLYDFAALRAFKAKLRPHVWDPIHLLRPPAMPATIAVFDVLDAFSSDGLLRFGARTMLRVPPAIVGLLAALLVPWTTLLAFADRSWFPSRAMHGAWVVFDILLCIGLFALSRRWRPKLATTLAVAITIDAALTALEAVAWNLPRIRGPAPAVGVAVAVAAPALAAALLWRARTVRT